MNCLLCLSDKAVQARETLTGASTGQPASEGAVVEVSCVERCGRYKYTTASFQQLGSVKAENRPLLSCWVWEQNRSGIVPTFTSTNIAAVLSSAPLQFAEKVKILLIYAADQNACARPISVAIPSIYATLQTNELAEVQIIVEFLASDRYVTNIQGGSQLQVTGSGFMKADEWRNSDVQSFQGFVAMSFDPTMDSAWMGGFEPGIRSAGYKALKISNKDYVGGITDEIMSRDQTIQVCCSGLYRSKERSVFRGRLRIESWTHCDPDL
jgi:hypothetical protein